MSSNTFSGLYLNRRSAYKSDSSSDSASKLLYPPRYFKGAFRSAVLGASRFPSPYEKGESSSSSSSSSSSTPFISKPASPLSSSTSSSVSSSDSSSDSSAGSIGSTWPGPGGSSLSPLSSPIGSASGRNLLRFAPRYFEEPRVARKDSLPSSSPLLSNESRYCLMAPLSLSYCL